MVVIRLLNNLTNRSEPFPNHLRFIIESFYSFRHLKSVKDYDSKTRFYLYLFNVRIVVELFGCGFRIWMPDYDENVSY